MNKYLNDFEKNVENKISEITKWIKDYVNKANANGVILGMSGGIDCSVVARLCQKANVPVMLVLMANGNSMNLAGDGKDAMELIEKFNFEYMNIPITDINKQFLNTVNTNKSDDITLSEMAISNINPKLRMTILYTLGQSMNYLVIGTSNKSEITMGYSTKFGDSACDFNPLGDFTKSEVRILGKALNLPERIILKPPSANLWAGQTDEDEMGITYKDLDTYILTGKGTEEVKNKVETTKLKVAHKNNKVPVFMNK